MKNFALNLNLHDQTYCHTTSLRPEYAQDMLKLKLDADVLRDQFNLDTMKREDSALHKDGANKILADVAYSVEVAARLKALITLLILEHKSFQDPNTPLQIAQQVTRAYRHFKHVVPFVFAQTDEEWQVSQYVLDEVRQIVGLGELHTPYFVINLSQISDERLLRGDLTAAVVWGTMKYRRLLIDFDKNIEAGTRAVVFILRLFRRTLAPYRGELFSIAGGYMQKLNKSLNLERLSEIERQNLDHDEKPVLHEVMIFDPVKAREKGLQEGMQQGMLEMAHRMLKANKPLSEICQFTKLSEAEIKKMQ